MTIKDTNQALQLLDSPRLDLRKQAILFLQKQHVREAIPLMLDLLLNDPDPGIRVGLVRTLASMGAKEAIPYLLDLILVEPESGVRLITMQALATLQAREATPLLLRMLRDNGEADQLRQAALATLKTLGTREIVAELAGCLYALDFPGALRTQILQVLLEQDAVETLIVTYPRTSPPVRDQLLASLGQVDTKPYVQQILRENKPDPVGAVLEIVYDLQDLTFLPLLLRYFTSWSPPLKSLALEMLKELPIAPELNQLFPRLEPSLQKEAMHWIAELELEECIPVLLKELFHLPFDLQQQARQTLTYLGVQQHLVLLLDTEMPPDLRILQALPVLDFQEALPYLLKFYAQLTPETREPLLEVFKRLKAVPYLLQVARDEEHPHRRHALAILLHFYDKGIAEHLINLVKDPDPTVALAVLHILENLKAREQIPALAERFHLIPEGVEQPLLELLRKLQAAPILLMLLKDSHNEQLIANLLKMIQYLEVREAAPDIVRKIIEAPLHIKLLCLTTLVRLNAPISLEKLLPLAQSKQQLLLQAFRIFLEHFQAEKTLLQWLQSPSPPQQLATIAALKLLHARAAIPTLLELLASEETEIKAAATELLKQLAPQPELETLIGSGDQHRIANALLGIYHLRLPEILPKAVAHYQDFSSQNRKRLQQIIERLHSRPALLEYHRLLAPGEQASLLELLEDLQAREFVPELLAWICESGDDLQARTVQAFERLDGYQELLAQLKKGALAQAAQEHLIKASAWLPAPRLIPVLIQILLQASGALQEKTLAALRKLDALPEVLKMLATAQDLEQLRGIQALGYLGAAETIPMVLECLHSASLEIQLEALQTLKKLNARSASPEIMKAALRSSGQVQAASLELLKAFQADQHFIPQMLYANQVEDRKLALQLLVQLHPDKGRTALMESLRDPKPEMRILALELLTSYEEKEYLSFIIKAISDIQPAVREKALQILVRMAPGKGLQYILDELLISSKALVPAYQKVLLNILCSIPENLLLQRIVPLMENGTYLQRLVKLSRQFFPELIKTNPAVLQFCLVFAIQLAAKAEIASLLWELLLTHRTPVRQFLQDLGRERFQESASFQQLFQFLLRFSNLNPKDIRYFYQLSERKVTPRLFLHLAAFFHQRLQALIRKYSVKLLSRADLDVLQQIYQEALEWAERIDKKSVSQYRQYLSNIQKLPRGSLNKIIPLRNLETS